MTLYRALTALVLVAPAVVACSPGPAACEGPAVLAVTTASPAWDAVPLGGPAPVDTVDTRNVIYTSDGERVPVELPDGAVINQLQRVRGGWVVAYLDAIRRYGLISADGALRTIEGEYGQDVLGISPDGTLIAVRRTRDRIGIYELPNLDGVANLTFDGDPTVSRLGEAHFLGPGAVLLNSGGEGDSGGPGTRMTGWNYRTAATLVREDLTVVTTFDDIAVVASDADGPTYDVLRVGPYLTVQPTGCLPSGRWSVSPDRKWLAATCLHGDCVRLLPLDDVLSGRRPVMRVIAVPGPAGRAFFAEDGDVLVTVEQAPRADGPAWGVLRCPVATGACTRATFAPGPTVAVIDVGFIQT